MVVPYVVMPVDKFDDQVAEHIVSLALVSIALKHNIVQPKVPHHLLPDLKRHRRPHRLQHTALEGACPHSNIEDKKALEDTAGGLGEGRPREALDAHRATFCPWQRLVHLRPPSTPATCKLVQHKTVVLGPIFECTAPHLALA
jgi:hypothetical protein